VRDTHTLAHVSFAVAILSHRELLAAHSSSKRGKNASEHRRHSRTRARVPRGRAPIEAICHSVRRRGDKADSECPTAGARGNARFGSVKEEAGTVQRIRRVVALD